MDEAADDYGPYARTPEQTSLLGDHGRTATHRVSPRSGRLGGEAPSSPGSFARKSEMLVAEHSFAKSNELPDKAAVASSSAAVVVTTTAAAALGAKPCVIILGPPRSGKSSMQQVVFHKLIAARSLFLETTEHVTKHEINSSAFCQFQIWDTPGDMSVDSAAEHSLDEVLASSSEVIFVVDVTADDTEESMRLLHRSITRVFCALSDDGSTPVGGPSAHIFIHKSDAMTDAQKLSCHRNLQDRIEEELHEAALDWVIPRIEYSTTSIFDHTIYEAFSHVVQRLMAPEVGVLEALLDALVNHCGIDKVFLFDVVNKLYVATCSTPVTQEDFELCFDMIEVIVQVSCLYQDSTVQGKDGGKTHAGEGTSEDAEQSALPDSSFGREMYSTACIGLSSKTVLYLSVVSDYLALTCIVRSDHFEANRGLIEHNIDVFRGAVAQVIAARRRN